MFKRPDKTKLFRRAGIAVLTLAGWAWTAPAGPYSIDRHVIAAGGTTSATSASYSHSATIGQSEAGVMTGGTFELSGGFWFAISTGDCNEDGIVNLADSAGFHNCLAGPGQGLGVGCTCYDFDANGDVTLLDFATLQLHFGR